MNAADGMQQAAARVERLRSCYDALRRNLADVIVGQDDVVKQLVTGLLSGGHVLVVGVPGLAKTLMVKGLALSLGWSFRRIQFTPDVMPADITGTEILQSEEGSAERRLVFRRGPIFANLVLADEINRTPPKTQAALLEAMQELAVTVGGTTYPLEPPFVVVATQNPIEQEGTYPLPEAQLDRFMLSIHMDYPTRDEELQIAARPLRSQLPEVEPVAKREDFLDFMQVIDAAPVADTVLDYAVRLTAGTRPQDAGAPEAIRQYVAWGAGPRATQHLITAARAAALLDGRPSPEIADVRDMALPVLRHRIVPNYNALGEGLESSDILRRLLEQVTESAPVGA